jgi:hypothetical protein
MYEVGSILLHDLNGHMKSLRRIKELTEFPLSSKANNLQSLRVYMGSSWEEEELPLLTRMPCLRHLVLCLDLDLVDVYIPESKLFDVPEGVMHLGIEFWISCSDAVDEGLEDVDVHMSQAIENLGAAVRNGAPSGRGLVLEISLIDFDKFGSRVAHRSIETIA